MLILLFYNSSTQLIRIADTPRSRDQGVLVTQNYRQIVFTVTQQKKKKGNRPVEEAKKMKCYKTNL